ncbi:hypothetical protein JTB14_026333 [Gonioctena quinquepunctata]|nr:hypothetical protein JTB14_026333 [Gonioctena quinquepunctata]
MICEVEYDNLNIYLKTKTHINNDEICSVEPSCSFEDQGKRSKRRFMKEVSSGSSSSETGVKKRKLPNNSPLSSGNSPTKRRIMKTIHNYSLLPDTENLKQRNRVLANRLNLLTAKLKNSRKTSFRRKMKVKTLSQVIREVNRKFALSKEATLALEASVSGTLSALVKRIITNSKIRGKKKITKQTFPAELRSFAITLQFYSSKAYKYVRETFNLALPAPATISSWLSKIDRRLAVRAYLDLLAVVASVDIFS